MRVTISVVFFDLDTFATIYLGISMLPAFVTRGAVLTPCLFFVLVEPDKIRLVAFIVT